MKTYPYVLRSMLIASAGGAANDIHGGLRDRLQQRFGCVPDCIKSLAIDYSTDLPTGFSPSETGVLALPGDCPAIASRMLAGEPDVAWLCPMILPDVLARYAGHEAAQVPAFTRAALSWTAQNGLGDGQPTWLDLLRSHLTALAPGGVALHDMVARGCIPASSIDHAGAILAVFIVGAEGGTGSAALIPLVITARWLAASLGLKLETHAWIVGGHYRPKDGDENAKSALAHALDIDLEYVMAPGTSSLRVPLGPDLFAEVRGRLFDSIYREEAAGRLLHDYAGIVAQCTDDLLFTYTTTAARDLMRSQVNKTIKPRLRSLAQRPAWGSQRTRKVAYGD